VKTQTLFHAFWNQFLKKKFFTVLAGLLNACRGKKVGRDHFLNRKEKKLQKTFGA
jgi:hypothetical protein